MPKRLDLTQDGPGNGLRMSRRGFLRTAGCAVAAAAVASYGCASSTQEAERLQGAGSETDAGVKAVHTEASDAQAAKLADVDTIDTQLGSVAVLSVPAADVFTTEDCEFIKRSSGAVKRTARSHLPYGTLLWANDDNVAACLLPCESAKPLTKIGLLSLENGNLSTVVKRAVGEKNGFHIYDVRANSQGIIWIEANVLNHTWRVYTAPVEGSGASIGKAQLAEEGGSDFELPALTVSGDYAFWQLSPADTDSNKGSKPNSMLMRVRFGGTQEDAKCVYEAPGRMACAPSTSENGVAIAPRANLVKGSGAYYQLTYIDADSGIVESALALPSGMKPTYIAYGPSGFSFAFESIYNYGDGISNLGTYVASGKDAPAYAAQQASGEGGSGDSGGAGSSGDSGGSGSSGASGSGSSDGSANKTTSFGEWFRFPRSPLTPPAWMSDWMMVNSTTVVAGIDLAKRRYFSIEPEYALQGYGEYLASEGPMKRIVTYANIDYTPIGKDPIKECNVRVFEAK